MTKTEYLQGVRRIFGPSYMPAISKLYDDAYHQGEEDAIPRIVNFANKSAVCCMMLVLHRQFNLSNEQIQNVWDETVKLIDEYTIDEILDIVHDEMDVLLVDSFGNEM